MLYDTVMVNTGQYAFVKSHRTLQYKEWALKKKDEPWHTEIKKKNLGQECKIWQKDLITNVWITSLKEVED